MSITIEVSDLSKLLYEEYNKGYNAAAIKHTQKLVDSNRQASSESKATAVIFKLESLIKNNPKQAREVLRALFWNDKISQIGTVRELSKMGLKEAIDFVETYDPHPDADRYEASEDDEDDRLYEDFSPCDT